MVCVTIIIIAIALIKLLAFLVKDVSCLVILLVLLFLFFCLLYYYVYIFYLVGGQIAVAVANQSGICYAVVEILRESMRFDGNTSLILFLL